MHLGPNIKRIRKRWRFQQEEFAKVMNSTKGRISQYELGNNDPKVPFLLHLERVTGIRLRVLYNRLIKDDEIPEKPLEPTLEIPPSTVQKVLEPDINHARKVSTGMLIWMDYMEHRVNQLEDQLKKQEGEETKNTPYVKKSDEDAQKKKS